MSRLAIPPLILLLSLIATPVWAATETYRLSASREVPAAHDVPVPDSLAETMMANELAQLQTVEVAGDTLVYDEAAGTAFWRGNVHLLAGSFQLTTDALELTFEPDPAGGEPAIQRLTAGPIVEIRLQQDLVVIRGERLEYVFPTREGSVAQPDIDILLPIDLLRTLGDIPLSIGDVRTTIHGQQVRVHGNDVTIEGAKLALLTSGGRDLQLTAARIEILNPHPDVTRLRTRNLRIQVDNVTLVKLPWTQAFNLRGSIPQGGFDVDFPKPFSAEEGLGLATDAHYVFDGGGVRAFQNTWVVGTNFDWVLSDRGYAQPYIAFLDPDLGELKLKYGTERGISALDDRSIPVLAAPELQWRGPRYPVTDWLTLRAELGIGHIDERSTARDSDRLRGTLHWSTRKLALGDDRLTGHLRGLVDQRFYEDDLQQRIAELGVVVQYVEPGVFGSLISWTRRDDTGFSPFLHDRLRLREEIAFREKAIGPMGWNGLLRGLYDIEESHWRTFELGVGKELEILEARLFYDTVSDAVRFELGYVGEI